MYYKPKRCTSLLMNPVFWRWLSIVLLAVMVAWPYSRIGENEFIIWDDPYYVYDNPMVTAGLSWIGAGWAWITFTASNWHPLTWLSHMLDSTLFGPTPKMVHLVNVGWYIGCVLLAFLLFLRLGISLPTAFFLAAFYGAHPLHVESVAWAAERKDILCTFFFLAAMVSYLHYARDNRKILLYFLTTVFFVLSLLSKPMAVTWPCVVLLMDFWPLRRLGQKNTVLEKIPWFLLSILSSWITVIAQTKSEALKSLSDFPLMDRIANTFISYAVYMGQTLWPQNLTVFYPYPYSVSIVSAVASFLLLGMITYVAFLKRHQHPYVLWGWLFYLGVLFPVIGVIQVGGHAHADRYTLLPQLGLIIAGGAFTRRLLTGGKIRYIAATAALAIITIFSLLTFKQVSYWKDSITLFNQNLEAAGKNETAHFNLGCAYLQKNQLDLSITHFLAALQMNPKDVTTLNNLGIAYLRKNQTRWAEECFRKAIEVDPHVAQPYYHLGVLKYRQGFMDEAMAYLDQAAQLAPQWREIGFLRDRIIRSQPSAATKVGKKIP